MTHIKKTITKILFVTLTLLTVIATNLANAQTVVDQTMCYGYKDNNLEAKGVTTVFLTTNEAAAIWVNLTDPTTSVEFKWYDPDDIQYSNTNADVIKLDDSSKWGIAFSSIKIDGTTAATKPGRWSVEMYIEDVLVFTGFAFQIIDYEAITEAFTTVYREVNDVRDSLAEVQAENEAIIKDYDELAADYAELVAQTSDQSDYEEIQDDYENLQDEYTQLQASLGTTRMMMYASVVVAIASVAIAVYFGALKK
jgi:hypothetical protein